jgi:hypothetical protein|tara:strand:+ start:118 stop:657 length:540 start_codon:yes stop_codon:yes gene_type:complete
MKPTKKNNSLYPNTKYVNKDMYMTDNENNEVIEDSLINDKKFKKEINKRVKKLIAISAPDIIIEREKYIATLTVAEYKNFLNEEKKEEKKRLNAYMKKNPLKEDAVKKLYNAFDKLLETPPNFLAYSKISFNMKLDPMKYVDEDEFMMGVYDPLIDSFQDEYTKKYKKELDEMYGYPVV